jgi:hypothetical protein
MAVAEELSPFNGSYGLRVLDGRDRVAPRMQATRWSVRVERARPVRVCRLGASDDGLGHLTCHHIRANSSPITA